MAVKSLVEVDIDTTKWARFQELFEKYQKQLEKTPQMWAAINRQSAGAGNAFKVMTAALLAQNQATRDANAAQSKQTQQLSHSERLWSSMAKTTKSVATNVVSATTSLIKWTGILGAVGGLLGAGGLFGIDRMAAGAAGQRRSAMGRGLSTGEQRAFQVNFERLVDPDAFLSWINTMETDITKQGPAFGLTGHKLSGRTGDDAIELLQSIRGLAKRTPLDQLGPILSAYGLDIDPEQQRRFAQMSDKEFNQLVQGYRNDKGALGISDDIGKRWQDFTTQMERAGASIFKTFVVGLAPLAGPLEHLSSAAVKFVETLLKSDLVKDAIDNVAKWLDNFSGKLSAPEFLNSISRFMSDIGALADAIHAVTHPGETIDRAGNAVGGAAYNWLHPDNAYKYGSKAQTSEFLSSLDKANGLPVGTMAWLWKQESGSSFNPKDSKAGAVGPFQFMKGTYTALGIDPHSFTQSGGAAAMIISEALKQYGDLDKALAFYNWGPGSKINIAGHKVWKEKRLDYDIEKHGSDWLKYAPTETQNYIASAHRALGLPTITVNVIAPPGFSASATVSGLAQ